MKKLFSYIIKKIKPELKTISIALIAGLILTSFVGITRAYSFAIQKGISQSVIRFHVLANSDLPKDQELKLMVRDEVLKVVNPIISEAKDINESREIIKTAIPEIEKTALRVIKAEGFDYSAKVYLTNEQFPLKTYGDIAFPAGEYEALKIEIGKAEGKNWWCVMFPPLCFVDGSVEISEGDEDELKNILTPEEYSVVITSKTSNEILPGIKFRIVEWWQEWEQETVAFDF